MPFKHVVDECDSVLSARVQDCAASDFIQAAIKTGFHVDAAVRETFMQDISEVLQCNIEALNFLFESETHEATALMLTVPNRKELLGLAANDVPAFSDLPDLSEAAE